MYHRYLKVNDACTDCGHPLGEYRADDGPAYFTILLVGHLVIAPLLFFPWVWEASPWVTIPAILIPLTVITLLLLPRVKGGVIGLLYSLKTTGEHPPGSELAASTAKTEPSP